MDPESLVPCTEDIISDESPSKSGSPDRIKRTVFTRRQLTKLEDRFLQQTFLSREERRELATELGLTDRQVMIWFQNRRGRLKRRGHHDSAYSKEKLSQLNQRRPYPFLYGLLSSLHYKYPNPHSYHNFPGSNTVQIAANVVSSSPQRIQTASVAYPCLADDSRSVVHATKNPVARILSQVDLAVELEIPDITATLGGTHVQDRPTLGRCTSSYQYGQSFLLQNNLPHSYNVPTST